MYRKNTQDDFITLEASKITQFCVLNETPWFPHTSKYILQVISVLLWLNVNFFNNVFPSALHYFIVCQKQIKMQRNLCKTIHRRQKSPVMILTLWEPGYDIFVLRFRPKTSSGQLPYKRHSSSADCAKELFKGSNESDSPPESTRKKIFHWGLQIFCEWRNKWSSFGVTLAHVAWPRSQPLSQSISLKFSLEPRLESKSFEPLIDFLAFLV